MVATADSYASVVSQRLASERRALSGRWLARLNDLLTVELNAIFPSDQLLDHIPVLIGEIATYVGASHEEEIAANATVIDKARELGLLRHQQQASVHQLLREYEILGEILESFLLEETERLGLQPSAPECINVLQRLTRATRALMRATVDTFVSEYTGTIQDQNERIRAFNRTASHELRSPIGTILFAAAMLDAEPVRADAARLSKLSATIRANAERLSWLIDNLQRLARLGEPLDLPSEQVVDLSVIAGEVARQLREPAAARNVMLRVASPLPSLVADPARLELVLLNLVSNGIKYSNPQQSEPFVEIASSSGPLDEELVIVVRDNGIGIPVDEQPAIFDRFFRGEARLDPDLGVSGHGLGLAIAAECVQALGGTIRCESTVGQGTTFFVVVPSRRNSPESPTDSEPTLL